MSVTLAAICINNNPKHNPEITYNVLFLGNFGVNFGLIILNNTTHYWKLTFQLSIPTTINVCYQSFIEFHNTAQVLRHFTN